MGKKKQQGFFDINEDWEEHWDGMPEYDNRQLEEPEITVEIKFSSKEDFDKFHEVIKKELYGGQRVFDGMQKKHRKTAWYPPLETGTKYRYK